MTLRLRRRGSRLFSMNEGRKSQIVLLDERRLDIIIQPKLYASELLDLVASHFKLKEKHFFGLGFVDETNHFNWLQGDKRVLDHELPKKTGHLLLYFSIKFYVETIGMLRDTQTVELFYLNARQVLFRGPIECDSETVFELAAHVLQACNGDFGSEMETREELKKLPLIPTRTLKEHPSISYCEDRVICFYEKVSGMSRGLAIVNYMSIIEKLQTYGIHYYDVKDKKDIPWWLGISLKGIAVYDKDDKHTPRKLFRWTNIENLYCRDKRFTIEVHSPKRIIQTLSSFNPYEDAVREAGVHHDDLSNAISDPSTQVSVSRRTVGGSNVDVHAWFCVTNSLTRCIWSMAVAQHLFDVECRQKKSHLQVVKSMADLATDLCRSTNSLPGSLGSDLSRSPSSQSLPSLSNSRYDLTIEQSDSLKAEREMYQALKARKEALEEAYRKKTEELKRLCFEEGELTGELPIETPLAPGEQAPTFRRRVGTAFSLSVKDNGVDTVSTELSQLELEVELQGKIASAAHRLASDKTVRKYVRKQRRQSYIRAMGKLKEMEKKLGDMRRQAGKPVSSYSKGRGKEDPFKTNDYGPPSYSQSFVLSPPLADQFKTSDYAPPTYSQTQTHSSHGHGQGDGQDDGDKCEDSSQRMAALSPSHSSPQLSSCPGGNIPNHAGHSSGYSSNLTTRNSSDLDSSAAVVDGTPGTLPLASTFRLDGSHDSGFSSANNMYNISSQRTSHYESTDQLRSPAFSEPGVISLVQTPSKLDVSSHQGMHGGGIVGNTMDGNVYHHHNHNHTGAGGATVRGRGTTNLHYGSLDRKQRNFKPDFYRDVSPMRLRGYTSQGEVVGDPDRLHGTVTPNSVILEVPVQYDANYSYQDGGGGGGRPSSSEDQFHQQQHHQQHLHQSLGVAGGHTHGPHYCYSPSIQEGSTAYHNVDVTHVHRRTPEPPGLKTAHHTASQPVFHRIERSVSPSRNLPPSGQQHVQPVQPVHSSYNVDRAPQPLHLPQYAAAYGTSGGDGGGRDSPHSIPIHHVNSSSYTPPPSSPVSSYPPSTPSSGASSPRTPVMPSSRSSTPSSLVTVSRLQPHMEVTKPYETSDFYRYSEKLRRQRIIDQYQRQLIGTERISRSSTPQSVESDGHSTHSGSTSHHSRSSPSPQSHPANHNNYTGISSQPPSYTRGPVQGYGRSASAPLSSMTQRHPQYPNQATPYYHQQVSHPPYHHQQQQQQQQQQPFPSSSSSQSFSPSSSTSAYPDGQITSSSSSSYSIKSQGAGGVHYAVQSSYKIQQVHSSTKHTLYHPPQPMTCRPVKTPPSFNGSEDV